MITIDTHLLEPLCRPGAGEAVARAVAPHLATQMRARQIDTPRRIAHFLAQIAHESDGFATLEEYGDGRRYEGRADLGNTRPGDGARFRGRGLIQLTGRANYRRMGARLGLDLESEPERAATPQTAAAIACAYWQSRDINAHADRDDLVAVTFAVNGGLNGLADRRYRLDRITSVLGPDLFGPPAPQPVLRAGDRGPAVASLQHALAEAGEALTVDGIFGPATDAAVKRVQDRAGLDPTGRANEPLRRVLASRAGTGDNRFMPLVKRSLSLAGHRTSLSLEPEFWDEVEHAAEADGRSLAGLIGEIDAARGDEPLASSVRVWVLQRLRADR